MSNDVLYFKIGIIFFNNIFWIYISIFLTLLQYIAVLKIVLEVNLTILNANINFMSGKKHLPKVLCLKYGKYICNEM